MITITWKRIQTNVAILARLLPEECSIWPIARGGYLVAALLQYERETITIRRTEYPYPDDIILDEICDSGKTLEPYHKVNGRTATLFVRYNAILVPTYWCEKLFTDGYLLFPWENERTEIHDEDKNSNH